MRNEYYTWPLNIIGYTGLEADKWRSYPIETITSILCDPLPTCGWRHFLFRLNLMIRQPNTMPRPSALIQASLFPLHLCPT